MWPWQIIAGHGDLLGLKYRCESQSGRGDNIGGLRLAACTLVIYCKVQHIRGKSLSCTVCPLFISAQERGQPAQLQDVTKTPVRVQDASVFVC